MLDTIQAIREAVEHAPPPGRIAPDLLGWFTPSDLWICASCASRMVGRGCGIPKGSIPAWADRASLTPAPCVACGVSSKATTPNT